MHYEVYIDRLFLVNMFLNLWSLQLLSKVTRCTATHLRLLLGAVLGAVCECILIIWIPYPTWVKTILAVGLVNGLMVYIGLHVTKPEYIAKYTLLIMGINVVFSGAMDFIQDQVQMAMPHATNMIEIIGISYISYWLLQRIWKWRRQKKESPPIYHIILESNGIKAEVDALLDTGNGLIDPLSGNPVSIVDVKVVEGWKPFETQPGFRMIPYHSVGKQHGILPGFLIEKMEIYGELEEVKRKQVMICIYEGDVCQSNQYQMILHPKLMEGEVH